MELKGLKINFLGDSIVKGSGVGADPEKRFTGIIEKETGAICRNYGIGGTRISRQTSVSETPSHDLDFISRVDEMDADADVVIAFGGTNDYGHGDAPLGNMNDRDVYSFYGALHTLYSNLIEKFPESYIIVITQLHRLGETQKLSYYNQKDADRNLKDYVNAIREVAEYYSLPVLDLYAHGRFQPKVPVLKEKYMPDGLHPNELGNKLIADMIEAFIRAL